MDDILKTVISKLDSGKLRVKCQSVQLKPITQLAEPIKAKNSKEMEM